MQVAPSYRQPAQQVSQSVPAAVKESLANVVMVSNRGAGGGSGCYLGSSLVLTCDHLFRDDRSGRRKVGRVVVSFPGGQASEAEVVQQDPIWDLALLRLKSPPTGRRGVMWATKTPAVGDLVVSCGFGGQGKVQSNVGRVRGYGHNKGGRGPADAMILSGMARGGDSGGPILDRHGRLAGVLWGSNNSEVVGTQVGRCWRFGKGFFGRLRSGRISRQKPSDGLAAVPTPGQTGPQGPTGPAGSPGQDADTDHTELELAIQRNASAIEAIKREQAIAAKSSAEQIRLIKESQKSVQNMLVLIQRNTKELERFTSVVSVTPSQLDELIVRIEQLERNTPVSFSIVAGKPGE